jgi:hypothetical protein
LGRQRAQALVVAGLLGQVGEQVGEPSAGDGQEATVVRAAEKDLGDRQGDQLGIADPGRAPAAGPGRQEIVNAHVKCRDEGVEVGEHEASMVDVALATPSFGALTLAPPCAPLAGTLESTI